jgi:CheY-like chemotaxis protein
MFRFFVVEDVRAMLDQLLKLLQEAFPGCITESALTVAQGLLKVHAKRPFDVAILDFKLPKDFGFNPEIDTSICEWIRSHTPETLIVHVSGYLEDDLVRKHVLSDHNEPESKQYLVSKSDPDWATELIVRIERYLYSKQIGAKMDELFGPEPEPRHPERRLRKEGHVTHLLADLKLDLEDFWLKLDKHVQTRVQRHFDLIPQGNRFSFSLRPWEKP